jgi:hypothetical protein
MRLEVLNQELLKIQIRIKRDQQENFTEIKKERGRHAGRGIELHVERIIELCTKRARIKTCVDDEKKIKEKT